MIAPKILQKIQLIRKSDLEVYFVKIISDGNRNLVGKALEPPSHGNVKSGLRSGIPSQTLKFDGKISI